MQYKTKNIAVSANFGQFISTGGDFLSSVDNLRFMMKLKVRPIFYAEIFL